MLKYLHLLWMVTIVFAPAHLFADDSLADSSPDSDIGARAFVVSGGVSLGSYEAGYLYFNTEALKATREKTPLLLAAGTSAGSINSLVSLINYCRPPIPNPQKSLGWETWIPVGFEQLFREENVTALSVFSTQPLIESAELIWNAWKMGLRSDCDVLLAITTTPSDPTKIELAEGLTVQRQEEKFVLQIRGRGFGTPPHVENYVDPNALVPQLKIRIAPDDLNPAAARQNFLSVRSLLFASAALPVAFKPQLLSYCVKKPGEASDLDPYCEEPEGQRHFVDGGVFDNSPLRLAIGLVERGLRRSDSNFFWCDFKNADQDAPEQPAHFVYLNTDNTAYPKERRHPMAAQEPRVIAMVSKLLGGFVSTARSRQLYQLAETAPKRERQVRITRSHFPLQSDLINAFVGFFEKDFRTFDFYLGIYDAFTEIEGPYTDSVYKSLRNTPGEGWEPLGCMVGWLDPGAYKLRRWCKEVDRNFLVMLQVAIDRVYSQCVGEKPGTLSESSTHHCKLAAQGGAPPQIPGLSDQRVEFRRDLKESQFDHAMRLFAAYGFHFKDLKLKRDEARFGKTKIRRRLLKVTRYLTKAQPTYGEMTILGSALRSAVNAIVYEPPRDLYYASAGTNFELGASLLPFEWNRSFLRLNLALQLTDAETLITSSQNSFRFSTLGGVEVRPAFLANPSTQLFFGFRAGYQFAVNSDRLGTRSCTQRRTNNDNRNCSQFVAQNYVGLTLADRLRLQATFEYYPASKHAGKHRVFDIAFGFGYQFF